MFRIHTRTARRSRGISLMEMVIAMAVTAVLMTSIVSLTSMVFGEMRRNSDNSGRTGELSVVRAQAMAWYDQYKGYEDGRKPYLFVASEDGTEVIVYKGTKTPENQVAFMRYDPTENRISTSGSQLSPVFTYVKSVRFDTFGNGSVRLTVDADDIQPTIILLAPKDLSSGGGTP